MVNFLTRWLLMCVLWGIVFSATAVPVTLPENKNPSSFSQANAIELDSSTRSVDIGLGVKFVISDVDSPTELSGQKPSDWQVNQSSTVSLGFQKAPHWFAFDLETKVDLARYWILEQSNPMVDYLSVYLYRNGELQQQWHTGDALPFSQRPLSNARFQFPLELLPDQRYQILLRVESTEALELPLVVSERSYHALSSERRSLLDGIFLGFLIIMAAYSLSIYLILRDISYFAYVCYVASMLLFFLSQQGLLYQYLFPQMPLVQYYSVPWISLLIFLSIVSFFQSFLGFKENFPRLWIIYRIQIALYGMLCLGLTVASYQVVVPLMVLNVTISLFLSFYIIFRLSLSHSRSAQIVLFGWGVLFIFLGLFILSRTGVFYNEFLASYGLRLGVSFEILIFSFALSFRINQERKDKEWALNKINQERSERLQAQELALEREIEVRHTREHSLQLEKDHRESLQRLVDERTAELAKTLEELEHANQELQQLSSRDGLTGLYNRGYFDKQLEAICGTLIRKEKPLSLLLLDVDHFKNINDTYGHPCGDMVLKELAKLLGSITHRPLDVIARFGGEEFALLLPDTTLEGAAHVAAMVVKNAAEKHYYWEGQVIHVTVSVGVHCMLPEDNSHFSEIIKGADQALYQAKQQGRNRYIIHHSDDIPS